jgi:hypothetical protein
MLLLHVIFLLIASLPVLKEHLKPDNNLSMGVFL